MIENRAVAADLNDTMLEIGARLDASLQMAREHCSAREFNAYREVVAELMTTMLLDFMNPLYVRHPDLKPPQLG